MGELPDMKGFFVTAALICVAIGLGLAWVLPELWALVKPWLHGLTA